MPTIDLRGATQDQEQFARPHIGGDWQYTRARGGAVIIPLRGSDYNGPTLLLRADKVGVALGAGRKCVCCRTDEMPRD